VQSAIKNEVALVNLFVATILISSLLLLLVPKGLSFPLLVVAPAAAAGGGQIISTSTAAHSMNYPLGGTNMLYNLF
jgi:hypothetical protein